MAATSDVNEDCEEKNTVEEVDAETEVNSQPNNIIKLEDLKVTELKSELEKRDLDKNGVKSVLIERLKAAIVEEGGDPDKYVNDISSDSCASKSMPSTETIEVMEANGDAESDDKSILEDKVDVTLQLLIDEEEAQLNDDDGLIDIPKEPEIESKLEESVQEECETPKTPKKNDSPKASSTKPSPPMKSEKTSNKDIKEKKIVKTSIQSKSTETVSALSPKVLKVIGKNDKLKSPTVLAKSLWITGLPDATRAADLKALFGKQGRVLSVKIVKSAKQTPGKCYGFVTMATSKDATKAMQNLHHTELNGRKISVEKTQNEPGTLLKKSETKTLTFTAKKTIRKEATTPKKSQTVQKDSKPVSKEASKMDEKATEGTKSSNEDSRKKDDKVNSAERAKLKEKERRSRERRDRERNLHRPVRRPIFKSRPFGFDRPRYTGFKQPFSSRPFSSRIGFGSSFKPRPNLLALQKLREEHYLRDRMRERREAERRRADERHRFIERKQREEAYRLEREKERLRMEREILDRERAEILRLEREKQRLERERIEREREELRRQAEIRSTKRPFNRIERETEPIWEERKKPMTKYDSRTSYHPQSSSSSRYEYLPRERPSFSRDYERHPEKFGAPKHLDILHRANFEREARREVTIRTRDERQVFNRSEFRERENRRSFSSRERERHSSSRRENPREDWKQERRVHERIMPGPGSSTQRRMAYY